MKLFTIVIVGLFGMLSGLIGYPVTAILCIVILSYEWELYTSDKLLARYRDMIRLYKELK